MFGQALGSACITNYWVPDGSKDTPIDRQGPRERLARSLDAILARSIDPKIARDAVEAKLFGLGSEAYVVGSHEFYLGYAITRSTTLCLDSGHFHPTEVISDKISSVLQWLDEVLLHVSRGVRWDSDHVVTLTDELQAIAAEAVRGDYLDRVRFGLDYFDASINRVAAWVVGTRALLKAVLIALLEPVALLRRYEAEGRPDRAPGGAGGGQGAPLGGGLGSALPAAGVPVGRDWLDEVRDLRGPTSWPSVLERPRWKGDAMGRTVLELAGVTKAFGGVRALKGVSFDLKAGEVHALVGENGAGKSTLIRVITGAHAPDSGSISIHGQVFDQLDPALGRQARGRGDLPATGAVSRPLGQREHRHRPRTARRLAPDRLARSARAGPPPPRPDRRGDRPRCRGPRPVDARAATRRDRAERRGRRPDLDPRRADRLAHRPRGRPPVSGDRRAQSQGVGLLYISHRLEELPRIADRVSALRDGAMVGTRAMAAVDRPALIRLMVGRDSGERLPENGR